MKKLDNQIAAEVQTKMRIEMRTLVERASRWLVNNRRPPLDSEATVDFFAERVQQVMDALPELLVGRERELQAKRRSKLIEQEVPDELATRFSVLHPSYMLLGIVEIADQHDLDPAEVARVHFGLGERLGIPLLVGRILELPRDDRWQTMARAALRDDLYAVHAQLTEQVLTRTNPEASPTDRIEEWAEANQVVFDRAGATLAEIGADEYVDLARMSVGLRVVRSLLASR